MVLEEPALILLKLLGEIPKSIALPGVEDGTAGVAVGLGVGLGVLLTYWVGAGVV